MLQNKEYFLENIARNMTNDYYWSDDWSEEFYIALAKAGFISTTHDSIDGLVLLPELQYEYAILDFKDLHVGKKIKKLLKTDDYEFCIDAGFDEVLTKLSEQHKYNWLKEDYVKVLQSIHIKPSKNFKLISVELICKKTTKLIAGEVGYIIGKTYTSLSGFSSREKEYANYGTLQLVLLSQYLEKNSFDFWNLGHPQMEYKKRLGCKIYSRDDFLQRWDKSTLCL